MENYDWYHCDYCGEPHVWRKASEHWKVYCAVCYKVVHGHELTISDELVLILSRKLRQHNRAHDRGRRGRLPGSLTPTDIKDLLFFTHPDRNGGDERANRITQKLLDLRALV